MTAKPASIRSTAAEDSLARRVARVIKTTSPPTTRVRTARDGAKYHNSWPHARARGSTSPDRINRPGLLSPYPCTQNEIGGGGTEAPKKKGGITGAGGRG